MSGPAIEFADKAPGVRSANPFREQELLHYYEGELEAEESTVRLITLAPTVTEDAIHEAFRRITGQWLNPSTHPNVVTVHERGREPRPWVAVERVDGRLLAEVQFPLSPSQVRTIVVDVAEALRSGAQYNSYHFALTPECIWLTDNENEVQAVVDEWGLERACQVATGETPATPFTAPELHDDPETGSERTDVYGLGAITYYALTGEAPTVESEKAISPPSSLNSHSDVTTEVDEVVLTALEPDPANRYDSAYAFQTALKQALPTADNVAVPDPERDPDEETSETGIGAEPAGPDTESAEGDGGATDESESTETTDTETAGETDPSEDGTSSNVTRRVTLGMLGIGVVGGAGWYLYPLQSQPMSTLWTFETGDGGWSSPAVVDGTVYVGSDDGNVYAVDADTGDQQWTFETGGLGFSSPTVVDGTVYVGSEDFNVYALDVSDGTEQWRYETGYEVWSSPAVVDGTVYVGSFDSNVYALDASEGTEQWHFETDEMVYSSPAVADGTVYVGSDNDNVYALDASDGTEQWRFETGDGVWSSPTVVDGSVYVGSDDTKVYAVDAETGEEQWRFETGGGVWSSPAVADGTVYVGSDDTNVYAVDASEGTEQWRFETDEIVESSPAVADGTVYVGSNDTSVYALDASEGTEQWRFETDEIVESSPTVADGSVYVGSNDGTVYALNEE